MCLVGKAIIQKVFPHWYKEWCLHNHARHFHLRHTHFPHGRKDRVPQEDDFVITAFVNNVDTKIDNDTLVATIRTNVGIHNGDADGISLSQNVPNPADNQAAVRYSIPQDGTVMFSILNVAGQVLYTQEVEAAAGTNSIVFNTENLAAGIYFYTMDFQGQRLMKKMVIRK